VKINSLKGNARCDVKKVVKLILSAARFFGGDCGTVLPWLLLHEISYGTCSRT